MTHGGSSIFTYRRLIPDSGCVEERERLLGSGEGEVLGVTVSSSVSSLARVKNSAGQSKIKPRFATTSYSDRWAPFVVRQLLLQQEDFGLELVPLVEDVPQLLQGEPGPVGVLQVWARRLLVAQRLLVGGETRARPVAACQWRGGSVEERS